MRFEPSVKIQANKTNERGNRKNKKDLTHRAGDERDLEEVHPQAADIMASDELVASDSPRTDSPSLSALQIQQTFVSKTVTLAEF